MAYAARPRIGLSDVVYAVLDESTDVSGGTPTYGTITPLANALELSFDPAGNESMLFADDGPAFLADNVGEMKLSFGIADIDPEDLAIILGHTYANGITEELPTDQSPYIAIGAKKLRSGKSGSSLVYDYFWLLKVKLMKPKEDAKTKGASIEFQTPMLEGMAVQLVANGIYRTWLRTDDANATSTTITNWFSQVVLSSSVDLGALNVAVAKNTTKARFTFTKTGGGNITLTAADLNTNNLPTYKGNNAVPVAGAYAITSGNGTATVVVDFTPTVAYGAVAVSGSVTYHGIKDQNGVYAEQTGAVWTSD
jgi:phi13 family phage major tail protein